MNDYLIVSKSFLRDRDYSQTSCLVMKKLKWITLKQKQGLGQGKKKLEDQYFSLHIYIM